MNFNTFLTPQVIIIKWWTDLLNTIHLNEKPLSQTNYVTQLSLTKMKGNTVFVDDCVGTSLM